MANRKAEKVAERRLSPATKASRAASGATETAFAARPQKTRLWLMYPPKLITDPVIWKLTRKFPVVTNVRQASVTDEIGIVCLELEGQRADIKAAIQWLEKTGIKVEPVEINVIES
jgi:ABC-type methionine transport system ATPase subunit